MKKIWQQQEGTALVMVIILTVVVGILVSSLMNLVINHIRFSGTQSERSRAYLAAQSGIQHLQALDIGEIINSVEKDKNIDTSSYDFIRYEDENGNRETLDYEDGRNADYYIKVSDNEYIVTFESVGSFKRAERKITVDMDISRGRTNFLLQEDAYDVSGPDIDDYLSFITPDSPLFETLYDKDSDDYIFDFFEDNSEDLEYEGDHDDLIDNFLVKELAAGESLEIKNPDQLSNSIVLLKGEEGGEGEAEAVLDFQGGSSIEDMENMLFILDENVTLSVSGTGAVPDKWGLDFPDIESIEDNENEISDSYTGDDGDYLKKLKELIEMMTDFDLRNWRTS